MEEYSPELIKELEEYEAYLARYKNEPEPEKPKFKPPDRFDINRIKPLSPIPTHYRKPK